MSEILQVTSLDFDGVLFSRPPVQAEAMAQWLLMPWTYNRPYNPGEPITAEERMHRRISLTPRETDEVIRHGIRDVTPQAKEFIEKAGADTIIVGNTGRPAWDFMTGVTVARLDEAGVLPYFDNFYFKPEKRSSDASKYWALKDMEEKYEKEYGGKIQITHYDDNARTVKRLAPKLPGVHFVIVQDLTTGILFWEPEMRKHPNVERIAVLNSDADSIILANTMRQAHALAR